MLAGALSRLAADAPKASPHDMAHLARTLRRTFLARNTPQGPQVRALSRALASVLHASRSYATTARATKPTATVKKAVKTATAKKAAPANKAAPTKKKAAAPKTTARRTAKKPAARKAAPKKVLTPEKERKLKIKELRIKALTEPTNTGAIRAINAFVGETTAGKGKGSGVAEASKAFKYLTPAEREHYNHIANEQTAAKRAEYEAFIKSHTPEQIRIANNARAVLRKLLAGTQKKKPAHTAKLVDDRQVKRSSPFSIFVKSRFASGDFHNMKVTECIKLIAAEWKALSAAEKKKFQDEAQTQAGTAA